ncbi:MAG: hypothetical protein JNK05_07005 [Myxococcales bacterium]|nr:hypothetical protein [Myxococcales bacterium]
MTFRDEDEARAARVDSLERENKELREKLAAAEASSKARGEPPAPSDPPRKKASPAPKPRAGEAPDKHTEKQRTFVASLQAVSLIVGVIAAIALVGRACRAWMPATIRRIEVVDGAIVVEASASARNYRATRLYSFDPASGAALGQLELEGPGTLRWTPSGRRAWFVHGDAATLVDLRTPAVIVARDDLARRIPALAVGYRLHASNDASMRSLGGSISDERSWYPSSLAVLLADGRLAWLDAQPRLLREQPASVAEPRVHYACLYYDAPSCSETRCWTWRREGNRTTVQLGWSTGWRTPNNASITIASPDAARLHSPRFIKTLDRGCVSEIAGGILVEHQQSALANAPRSLSLVSREGQLRWTVSVASMLDERASVHSAVVQGSRASLLLGDVSGERVSLESISGRRLVLVRIGPSGAIESKRELL